MFSSDSEIISTDCTVDTFEDDGDCSKFNLDVNGELIHTDYTQL